MSIFIKIRNILLILKIFYWFSFRASIRAIRRKDISLTHQYWSEEVFAYFRASIHELEGSQKMRREKTLLLTNHRTQADFFIHSMITEHQANVLARMLVAVMFMVFAFTGRKSVWFFNRSGNIDPEKFNRWLDQKYAESPRPILLAYPEGHRMGGVTKVDKDKFKTGMIRYAYRRGLQVQMLMSFGNELIFNEKKLEMNWDQSVYYSFSKVYRPADYQDENDFVNSIKEAFASYFDAIYQQYTEKMQREVRNKAE